jgi:hypothetical protein
MTFLTTFLTTFLMTFLMTPNDLNDLFNAPPENTSATTGTRQWRFFIFPEKPARSPYFST